MKEQKNRERLLRSFDQELTPDEQSRLEQALEDSEELRREKDQLLRMRRMLADLSVPADEAFTGRVMNRLPQLQKERLEASIIRLFPKVAAACLLLFLISLLSIYFTEGSLSAEAIIGLENISLEDTFMLTEY